MRLQKYLAACGVGSRRKCEQWIQLGQVTVDGAVVTEMGVQITPNQQIVCFQGVPVVMETESVYLALNKPVGYITSSDDQFGRATVLDLVADIPERIFPVGRLDYHSSGLLILTNDGDFANKMTHPRYHIEKTYRVSVVGAIAEDALERLRQGILLGERRTAPAQVKLIRRDADISAVEITLHEGRNRQVRRMCDAVGHAVISLCRTQIGSITLAGLESGAYRRLSPDEIQLLLCGAGATVD